MAAFTGPIPNRSDQRVRRNLPDVPVEAVQAIGIVLVPELGIDNPHPVIEEMWESLKNSAQKKYYEPSDWAYAKLTMYVANEMLTYTNGKAISSMKLAAVDSMLTKLLMTEGDRRRLRIEIERKPQAAGENVVQVADLFRQRLAEGQNRG